MKKLFTSLLCLVLLCGCSAYSNREDSVQEITLSVVDQDYYKGEEIPITIKTNCKYQLKASDFVMFGGSIEIKDLNTAILCFTSSGTFHVYAMANNIKSNEISIKVVASNAHANRAPEGEESKEKKEFVRAQPQIPYTENDFMDIEALYYADPSELTSSDHVAENIKSYVGYMFAMQGYMPDDGSKGYLLSDKGRHIPLINGYNISIIGPIRVYGIMEENGFYVKTYSYGS